jgi:RNA polymerase sigma-70 factor (ECF subfamily)
MVVYADVGDDKLVQAACRGDVDCFAELYRRHIAKAVAVAFCELSDQGLAEDAAQESFAEACRSLQNLRDTSKFSYWLATICRRVAGRIKKRHRRHPELTVQDVAAPANDNDSYDEEIRDAVDKLPHLAREVIILHYFGELPHAEIAATLDITAAAVHGRLVRAREQLKEYLMRKGLGVNIL